MKLRPYHNPENIDESKIPDGWRFRYADEMKNMVRSQCRRWHSGQWSEWLGYMGTALVCTYIVQVNS